MLNYASKHTRKKRLYRWIGYGLTIFVVGSMALLLFSISQKKFFPKQEAKKAPQERWLYWCAGEETNPCFYVARDGASLGAAPYLSGTLFPKFYGSKELLMKALPFVERFYAFGKFAAADDETLEIGWPDALQIKVSFQDSPEHVAENLALVLEKEISDRKDKVEYIDLRFGNKVYYKMR